MPNKRCFNCLSVKHVVRAYPYLSKYCKCGTGFRNKLADALSECYNRQWLGAAEANKSVGLTPAKNDRGRYVNACNGETNQNLTVLLRPTVVKVINPMKGKSTLVYMHCSILFHR